MKSRPFPEIPCVICSKPVDLGADLSADENGKAVHADCYVERMTTPQVGQSIATMGGLNAITLAAYPSRPQQCQRDHAALRGLDPRRFSQVSIIELFSCLVIGKLRVGDNTNAWV
jgi:hypothetical protein